jgi:CHAT domain-containing protein
MPSIVSKAVLPHRAARHLLRAAVLAGGLAAAPAMAAEADDLCTMVGGPADLPAYPADAALTERAASLEAALAANRPLSDLKGALAVPGSVAQPPSAGALAAYCAAAGEAARTSSQGGQFQAHAYLMAAFRNAEAAGIGEASAQAAYRLGLVHAVEVASAGGRGTAFGLQSGADLSTGQRQACEAMRDPDPRRLWGRYLSEVALECAVTRAGSTREYALSSLSSLRLARLAMTTPAGAGTDEARLQITAQRTSLGALDVAQSIPDPVLRAEVMGRLVETAIDTGGVASTDLGAAIGRMRAVSGSDAGSAAFASALEGRLALAAGDRAGAAQSLQQAVFLEAQRPMPWRLADWLLLLADADPANRHEHVSAAYRSLESIRPYLPVEDPLTRESTFGLRMRKVFEAAVADRFAATPAHEAATIGGVQQVVEAGRQFDDPRVIAAAQEVIEAYRQAEIQSLFGNDCAPPATPFRPADLRAGEVVLYPVVLADRIELIYADGSEDPATRRFRRLAPRFGTGKAEVQAMVAQMMTLGTRRHGEGWQVPARRLYELLIAPIEGRLGPNSTLIVVPDNTMRTLPFAALTDGQDRYLIERTRLAIAPALAYLQPGGASSAGQPRVVAAALSQEVTLPAGVVFAKLENTAGEARAVAGIGQSGVRHGRMIENFSKADLEGALRNTSLDVLHLATHASFNGGSDRSFIIAADQLILMSQLRELIAERRTRGADLALLVLSACETAVGDDQAAMGLAGAAIQAGATSALASLWQVDDTGTAELMRTFYDGLRAGKSRSDALRSAQAAMIAKGGRVGDPWVWAAFTMLGGWR